MTDHKFVGTGQVCAWPIGAGVWCQLPKNQHTVPITGISFRPAPVVVPVHHWIETTPGPATGVLWRHSCQGTTAGLTANQHPRACQWCCEDDDADPATWELLYIRETS